MITRGQTRKMSFLESAGDTTTSLVVGVVGNLVVMPMLGLHPTIADATVLTVIFTVIGITRRYLWRRLFNWLHIKGW